MDNSRKHILKFSINSLFLSANSLLLESGDGWERCDEALVPADGQR